MSDYRDNQISSDFRALKRSLNSDQRPLEDFILEGARIDEMNSRKVDNMSVSKISTSKRFLVPTAATAVVAAILFFVPISYSRTVGWDASLSLSASNFNSDQLRSVATELKAALGAEAVRLELEQGRGGQSATMSAFVDANKSGDPGAKVQAFAKFLSEKGYQASALCTPREEEVSANVIAMTLDRVIEVEQEGKTAEELEAEITARLKQAGIKDVEVTVTREDGDKTKIQIEANCQKGEDDEADSECPSAMPDLVITKDGEIPDGDRVMVKHTKELVDGVESTVLMMDLKGQKAVVKLAGLGEMSEDEVAEAVAEQLKAQGIDLEVKIMNGEINVGPYPLGKCQCGNAE